MEFEEARGRWLAGWNCDERILGGEGGNFHEMGNYGPAGGNQVNNALGGSQLTGLQYKLMQGIGKYSSERTKKIVEQEMPAMRKEIPKAENSSCYVGAERRAGGKISWGA